MMGRIQSTLALTVLFLLTPDTNHRQEASAGYLLSPLQQQQQSITRSGRCERITIPLCSDLRYNMTRMPNLVGHASQNEAALQVNEFIPLVQIGCSRLLKFFLCSIYAPMCTEQVDETMIIPACRSMCLKVKTSCEPILLRFHFQWPEILDCSSLPERNDRSNLCIDPPNLEMEETSEEANGDEAEVPGGFARNLEWTKFLDALRGKSSLLPAVPTKEYSNAKNGEDSASATGETVSCPDRFVSMTEQNDSSCSARCDVDVMFRSDDKRFAEVWMTVWASVCFASTLLTVFTCLLDTSRFRYPEKPIIFLSACYTVYSVGFLVREIVGSKLASCSQNTAGRQFLIDKGLENTWCIVVFLILYYFGMASCIWWVILSIAWYLAANRKWGFEAIQALESYFHLAAWAIPAVKTITILTLRWVDADELTGLCYVGNRNKLPLGLFVLAPMSIYLLAGSGLFVTGLVAMFRIKRDLRELDAQATAPVSGMPLSGALNSLNIRNLEKLMAKMGVFSILYVVPMTCVVGCIVYELVGMDGWREGAMQTPCRSRSDGSGEDCSLERSIPAVEVFMLKIFMSVAVGITSGMWIWSPKTAELWRRFLTKCCMKSAAKKPNNKIGNGRGANDNNNAQRRPLASGNDRTLLKHATPKTHLSVGHISSTGSAKL